MNDATKRRKYLPDSFDDMLAAVATVRVFESALRRAALGRCGRPDRPRQDGEMASV